MSIKNLVKIAVVASIYVVFTVFLPFQYGAVQFRIAEVLLLLCFFKPYYGISIILGCILANFRSELGPIDVILGTCHSAIAVLFIIWISKVSCKSSPSVPISEPESQRSTTNLVPRLRVEPAMTWWWGLWIASLGALIGTPLIGWMLYSVLGLPFVASTLWVMLGEFVVVTIIGVPLFKVLEKTKTFKEIV